MTDKRKAPASQGDRKKKKYRSDGTPVWAKRYIDGPGIWVSCVKGKESAAVSECYDLFNLVASEIWPEEPSSSKGQGEDSDDSEDEDLSIEDQIAKEVSEMKKSKAEPRFVNCQTNTQCVAFVSCKSPIDPVELVFKIVDRINKTGLAGSRFIHRLLPVSDSCVANVPEVQALCRKVLSDFLSRQKEEKLTYKIELRMRNHSTMTRPDLIQKIAECVPQPHSVSLDNPDFFILIEVFKSVCGISVVRDYYKHLKFNLMELANKTADGANAPAKRVDLAPKSTVEPTP